MEPSTISDTDLDRLVAEVKKENPTCGEVQKNRRLTYLDYYILFLFDKGILRKDQLYEEKHLVLTSEF